jgi:hypothetical protein
MEELQHYFHYFLEETWNRLGFTTFYSEAIYMILICFVLYTAVIYTYRLCLHPLAKFPGPKLAALSNWYEFYYEIIKQGNFTHHIQTLHKQYGMSCQMSCAESKLILKGPIIRITPSELHIDDPSFYDTFYERSGRKDRYLYFSRRFGYASDTFQLLTMIYIE